MSVIDRDKYFTSLPRDYYFSEERFNNEIAKVWLQQWVYAGHVSQVPAKGDYFTLDLHSENVIVIRKSDDEISAMYNVCRHRGVRLLDKPAGHIKRRIVCPYHSWSYGLDGRLLTATHQPDGQYWCYKDRNLIEAHVSVWQGFIFVSMADKAPAPVASMIDADSAAKMTRLEPEQLKIAHEITYETDSNWKLLLENGVECYHCPTVHPEFCVSLNATGMSDYYSDSYVPDIVQGLIIPVKPELESLSMDGSYLSKKLLGEFGRGAPVPPAFGTGFMTQPGYCWAGFHPDYGMVASTLPVSPTRSKMICQWFVRHDAQEGIDYDVSELIKIWDITNHQDLAILERQQRGIATKRYIPGPNSPSQEAGIRSALKKYLEMMGEKN